MVDSGLEKGLNLLRAEFETKARQLGAYETTTEGRQVRDLEEFASVLKEWAIAALELILHHILKLGQAPEDLEWIAHRSANRVRDWFTNHLVGLTGERYYYVWDDWRHQKDAFYEQHCCPGDKFDVQPDIPLWRELELAFAPMTNNAVLRLWQEEAGRSDDSGSRFLNDPPEERTLQQLPSELEQKEARRKRRNDIVLPLLASRGLSTHRWAVEAKLPAPRPAYAYLKGDRDLSAGNRANLAKVLGLRPEDLPH